MSSKKPPDGGGGSLPPDINGQYSDTTRACLDALNTVYDKDCEMIINNGNEMITTPQFVGGVLNSNMKRSLEVSQNNEPKSKQTYSGNNMPSQFPQIGQFLQLPGQIPGPRPQPLAPMPQPPIPMPQPPVPMPQPPVPMPQPPVPMPQPPVPMPQPPVPTPETSSSTTYVSAYEKNKNNRYSAADIGPFYVFIESKSNDQNLGRLHHIALGKLIYNTLKDDFCSIVDIDKINYKRVKVTTKTFSSANKILDSQELISKNISAYIPESKMFRKGVVRHVDRDLSLDEIQEMAMSEYKIMDVQRMTRKITAEDGSSARVSTETVVINFRGQVLPNYIFIYGARCKVEPYVYRVSQCLNCLRYGHIAKFCKSSARCENCGKEHEAGKCPSEKEPPKCVTCGGAHKATNRDCPGYKSQVEIKKFMAFHNLTFKEAKNQYRTYSQIAAQPGRSEENSFPDLVSHNRFDILSHYNEISPSTEVINTSSVTRPSVSRPRYRTAQQSNQTSTQERTTDTNFNKSKNSSLPSIGLIQRNPYAAQYHRLSYDQPREDASRIPSESILNTLCEKIENMLDLAKKGQEISSSYIKDLLITSYNG